VTRFFTILIVFGFFGAAPGPGYVMASGLDDGLAAIQSGDYQAALQAFRPLAEQGDARAQYQIGQMHGRGHGTPKNYDLAAQWYRKAAEQGHAEAQFDLGSLYLRGVGVPRNNELAAKWWRRAADSGDAAAQSALGDMYLEGVGVEPDLVQAYKWLMLAEPRTRNGRIPWGAIGLRDLAKRLTVKQRVLAEREVRKWIAAHKP
jgi:TPR repeat protein